MKPQPFLFPPDLFGDAPPSGPRFWVCARTRSRFEKRLCRWLQTRNIGHFLPTLAQRKTSSRTRYEVDVPLIPGYVFLLGDHDKGTLKSSYCVTAVLRPSASAAPRLDQDLWSIWRGLVTGSHLELTRKLAPGDIVEITTPPYAGMTGRFERWGNRGRLHVWLDIMGCGAVIELSEYDVSRPV